MHSVAYPLIYFSTNDHRASLVHAARLIAGQSTRRLATLTQIALRAARQINGPEQLRTHIHVIRPFQLSPPASDITVLIAL